jgi:hypothetical protein
MIEFICQDCGHAVTDLLLSAAPVPPRCCVCQWIEEFIPVEERQAVRQRLVHLGAAELVPAPLRPALRERLTRTMIREAPRQIPPADELHSVRAQLKALEEREAELRQIMLADPSARTGNRFVVELREVVSQRTDLKELRAMYPDLVAEYTQPVATTRVELRAVTADGEVVAIPRKRRRA